MNGSEEIHNTLRRGLGRALAVGVAASILCIIGAIFAREVFFRSYLVAYLLVLGLGLGSMVVTMLHNLTGGGWGLAIRRVVESGNRTIPLLVVLFIPILFGTGSLYDWATASGHAHLGPHKQAYLSFKFWLGRAIIYLAIWLILSFILERWSRRMDANKGVVSIWFQKFSGLGILIYGITMTLASVDWVMSIDSHWYSSIFGMIFVVGQTLLTLAFGVAVVAILVARKPVRDYISPTMFQDLASLMLVFVILWAYMAFSQFLIIWMGNIKEEVPWYVNRTYAGWKFVAIALILFHFALPFFLLLNRPIKRNPRRLIWVAVWIILMRILDLIWMVTPSYRTTSPSFGWMYIAAPLALGGLWLAYFLWQLNSRPLVPSYAKPVPLEGHGHA